MITYLIDANNLIGKISSLKKIHDKDKQASREKLIFLLENYFHSKNVKIYVHFDGYENIPLKLSRGKIIYSEKFTADKNIKSQIEASSNRRNLTVVSSDHEIQNFAKVCSCKLLSSEEFGEMLTVNNIDDEETRIKGIDNEEFKRLFDPRGSK